MQSLATLVMSVINSDLDKVLEATMSLCDADKTLKFDRAFRRDAWSFIARFERGTIESLDMAGLLNEFFALMRRYRIRCPADLVFLIKALSTIQGVAREIDPTVRYCRARGDRNLKNSSATVTASLLLATDC